MSNTASLSLLEQLEASGCLVDVDSFVPEVAKSLPFVPHDATSNQALIGLCILNPVNHDLVCDTVKSMPGASALDVLTVLHAKFGRIQSENISGRVLVQTSPSFPHNEEQIVQHGKAYATAFLAEGVQLDRFAIKIPTTSAGVRAAKRLKEEGIQSLGTTLFSLPQAIAASQAGMYAISPYFNPCLAHSDSSMFCDVADPTMENPMSNRLIRIRQTYNRLKAETGERQPQIKGAGFVTAREVLAQLELGCDHVTVLPACLEDLSLCTKVPEHAPGEWSRRWKTQLDQPQVEWSTWSTPSNRTERVEKLQNADPLGDSREGNVKLASTDIDYLSGDVLDECNQRDEATRFRLADAVATFKRGEDLLLDFLRAIQDKEANPV